MAGLEDLAQYIVMGDANKQIAAEDPYAGLGGLGDAMIQVVAKDQGHSLKEKLIAGLATGLFGGIFKGMSDSYQGRARDAYQDVLLNTIQGNEIERPDVLSNSIFRNAKDQGSIFNISQALQQKQAEQELQSKILLETKLQDIRDRNEIQKAAVTEFIKNPRTAGPALKQLGIDLAGTPESIVETGTTADVPIAAKPPSLLDKIQETTLSLMDAGVPGGAAAETAKTIHSADTNEMRAAQKRVDDLREQANAMTTLADTAEAGVSGAGNTGGLLNGPREAASWIWSMFSGDEQKQRDSQAILDSVAPDVIKASRAPGSGAMSDPEMRAYLSAGPSSSNTPSENAVLIDKLRNMAGVQKDYADFLDWYRNTNQTLQGAQGVWDAYKQANPMFSRNGKEMTFNKDRQSWRDFIAQPSQPQQPTGQQTATRGISQADAIAELKRRGVL